MKFLKSTAIINVLPNYINHESIYIYFFQNILQLHHNLQICMNDKVCYC